MIKINGMKITGLRKAVSEYNRYNAGGCYSPEYAELMFDTETGQPGAQQLEGVPRPSSHQHWTHDRWSYHYGVCQEVHRGALCSLILTERRTAPALQ